MEEFKRITRRIEKVLQRSWRLGVPGAVLGLTVMLVGGMVIWRAGAHEDTPSEVGQSSASTTSMNATTTEGLVSRALDGVLVPPAESRLQAYAVMVENHVAARPLSGPAKANLVFAMPVEGGITRYMLVFDATSTIDMIGPVRSARPYFVDMAEGLRAVYAHVGGSPEALAQISRIQEFRDINEFFHGRFFWRSHKRSAPHNVYTRMDLLREAASTKAWSHGDVEGWEYKEDATSTVAASSTVPALQDGPAIAYGGAYSAMWKFDSSAGVYQRFEAGSMQKDQDGTPVRANNVVVLITEGRVVDAIGRLKIRTTGTGKAYLYQDGERHEVTWERSAGGPLRFRTPQGAPAMLNRGSTWVEVVLDQNMLSRVW